jgi:hypothetical protein
MTVLGAPRRLLVAGSLLCALTAASLLVPTSAWAVWSAAGSGSGEGAAATMPTGNTPTATPSGNSVLVSWSPVAVSQGTDVAGYVVSRYDAVTGNPAVVGGGCSGVVTTTSCTESSVPTGNWVYTDTPVQLSWTGGASALSAPVAVP